MFHCESPRNWQSPQSFGALSWRLNSPRIVQLGLHIDF
jgi:hypothetical protein